MASKLNLRFGSSSDDRAKRPLTCVELRREIKNVSVLGFYMVIDKLDRLWTPGTVIRVTLQALESDRTKSHDSITVSSRIVFWGPDGGGFEFVFSGAEASC